MNLNRLVSIEYRVKGVDSATGTETLSWTRLVLCHAEVQDVLPSRAESVRLGMEIARNQTRIRIRWRNDIDSSMRIVVHGDSDTVYQIVGGPAEIYGRKRYLEMMCERYSTAGD